MLLSSVFSLSRVSSRAASRVVPRDSQAAARGNRCDERPFGREIPIRFALWAILCVGALSGFAPSAEAQTAHFGGTVTSLGGVFSQPPGVAVDGSGDIFVADVDNNAIREILAVNGSIPANPTINTLGSGFNGPEGVAVDGSGNVFVADFGNSAVKEILAAGGYTTVNTLGSGFSHPHGVAVDGSGNVFVADTVNHAVKEITAASGYTTVNTLGSGFAFPEGVAVDGNGNVFVADNADSEVKEILASSGYTTVNILGSGFNLPAGVAVDGSGNVFVADGGHGAVKEILASSGYTTVNSLGSGFGNPQGVAVDGMGNVVVADFGNNAVKEIMLPSVNFGSVAINTSTPVTLSFNFTFDIAGTIGAPAVLTQGAANLDFTDAGTGNCTMGAMFNAGDTCTINVSFTPKVSGVRYGAATLTDGSGAVIATAHVYGTGAGPQVAFSPGTQSTLGSGFNSPGGEAVDASGNVFVADESNNAVKEILFAGGTVNTLGSGFNFPASVAVDGSGNVFVADLGNNAVKEILAAGGYTNVNTLAGG
jgi:sugar lactone lactonase YvrE